MRLKSLELHGFKSFPEKTVITFDAGTTVIVGPNGSGKSNITDAMRWVLGELSTKNIRGSKMEDVIFVGADGYRPMGFAEVSVTFDNSDPENRIDSPYDEITVTRRYYRAGESEYYINRKAVRLKDIHELFMNTGIGREGYSIIGQGRIAEIVSKKSEERRGIFDETAGIAKYRFKKQEAQRKLDATEANMTRVADSFAELSARVGPLEKQSRRAREYLELFAQKKEVDVALWLYDMQRMVRDEEKTKNDCIVSQHELETTQDTENRLSTQYDRLFESSQQTKQESARLYEKIRQLEEQKHTAENAYTLLENDAAHKESEISAAVQTAEKLRTDMESAEQKYAAHEQARRSAQQLLQKENETLAAEQQKKDQLAAMVSEKENALERLLSEQKQHEAAQMDYTVRLNVLQNTLNSQSERSGSISGDMEKYQAEQAALVSELSALQESVAGYAKAMAAADDEITACTSRENELRAEEEKLARAQSAQGAQIEALESRVAALRNMMDHFDGYNNSVRFVMNEAKAARLSGIHGPVSHLISVKPEYTVALETALGAALQNIVVDDEAAAKNAIYALKRAGSGRATFYPLTSVKSSGRGRDTEEAAGFPGFIGFADTLVSYDARYAGVIGSLLARIAVFDNLDNATVMARRQGWRVRAVTLDGQQINAGGSFTGGAARRDSGILTRSAQIDSLTAQKTEVEKKQNEILEQLRALRAEIAQNRAAFTRKKDEKDLLSTLQRADQAELDKCTARRSVIENLLADLNSDLQSLREQGERGDSDIRALSEARERESARIAQITEMRETTDVERGQLEKQLEALSETISQVQIRLAEMRKDLEVETKAVLDAGEELARLKEQILQTENAQSTLRETLRSMQATATARRAEADELLHAITELESERAALDTSSTENEKKQNTLRLQMQDISARKERIVAAHEKNENKHAQLCADMEKMTQRLWDEYELTPTAAAELSYPAVEEGSRAPTAARLAELKSQIKALGHVNVDAIDEYAEVKERYDFMRVQMDDLTASKNDLLDIIGSIEGEMETMFMDAFEKINQNFGEVFRDLFGGGEAHLSLSDPANVLTSGIEISAAPPGKMIKNLALLSGGEQSVIAIALLFALVRVNPSPFCIFDEIEAALDEVNVQRVAHYVQRVAQSMQIIMITHRRGTMEVADALYGVTMPRRGVSKVFQLDMATMTDEDMERAL